MSRDILEAVRTASLRQIQLSEDGGWILPCGARSLILKAMHHGRRLTDKQRIAAVMSTIMENDRVAREKTLPFRSKKILNDAMFPDIDDNVAYKFCPSHILEYWKAGSIQVCPPSFYRTIENELARDRFEGYAAIGFHWEDTEFTTHVRGGNSHLVMCLTRASPKSSRNIMKKKFGDRLLKIVDLRRFAERISYEIGASRTVIKDIVYTDFKCISFENEIAVQMSADIGAADLSAPRFLSLRKYFDNFLHAGELPSIFCKPQSYYDERERRIAFAMPYDSEKCRIINLGSEISEYIEVIE